VLIGGVKQALARPFVAPALDKLQIFALATQVMSLHNLYLTEFPAQRIPFPSGFTPKVDGIVPQNIEITKT
jgi:hypothetical protein